MGISVGFSLGALKQMFAVKPKRQLRELYTFLLCFSFAASLITIFEPVFFYQEGYAVWQICLYYLAHYIIYTALMPLGAMFSARFGYERSLAISSPIFVVYFLVLASLPNNPSLFWVAVVVLSVFKTFYWPAFHANFAAHMDGKNGGTEQSWSRLIQFGAGIVGPVLGGFVVAWYGFPALFMMAAVAVAAGGALLLRTPERFRVHDVDYMAPWRIIFGKRHRHMTISMMGWAEDLVHLAIWPLWLFIVLGSVEKMGAVASMSAAVAVMVGFLVGEVADRMTPRRSLRIFVPLLMVGYAFRAVVTWPWAVVAGDVYARTGMTAVRIPFASRLYKLAKKEDTLVYSTAFEMALAISKILGAAVLMILFLYVPLGIAFPVTFILAGLSALLYMVL